MSAATNEKAAEPTAGPGGVAPIGVIGAPTAVGTAIRCPVPAAAKTALEAALGSHVVAWLPSNVVDVRGKIGADFPNNHKDMSYCFDSLCENVLHRRLTRKPDPSVPCRSRITIDPDQYLRGADCVRNGHVTAKTATQFQQQGNRVFQHYSPKPTPNHPRSRLIDGD